MKKLGKLEYAVVDRFGKRRVLFRGRRIIPLVDQVVKRGSLEPKLLELGNIAGLAGTLVYRIGRASDVDNGNWERVSEAVLKRTYTRNLHGKIRMLIGNALWSMCAGMMICEVDACRHNIERKVCWSIEDGLADFGIYIPEGKNSLYLEPFIHCRSER